MVERTEWVERKFEFGFPVGIFPCIIERLRGTSARLEEITAGLPREQLTEKVAGKWSIQEHVGHIENVDALHDGRLDQYLAGADALVAADMSNARTEQADHNSTDIKSLLASVRATREALVRRLEALDEQTASRSAFHPRLKTPMRIVDMAFFAAEHDDHHVAAITELARTLAR